MVELMRIPFQIFFLLPFLSTCSSTEQIASCLSHHNIKNFTTFPQSENESKTYYSLLNYSIQNLRFTDHTISKPIAIILPDSLEQLVNIVLCCREGSWEIRVRCGGHSYEGTSSASSNKSPFIVIDMMNLKQINVSIKDETAWVQGGATLGETYYEIARASNGTHGFSAGSCPTVGMGGHISGGGFGLLSRKYGLAADNVVDALLVDANGKLLDKEAMGEDVFWAIRGGGGGVWGIVYAWKIRLLKVPQVVTSFIVSRPGTEKNVAKLVYKWQHAATSMQDDFYLSCFVGAGLPETKKTNGLSATFKGFYLGKKTEALSILERVFPELNILEDDCKETSWIDSVVFFSGLNEGSSAPDLQNRYLHGKNYFKGKSDFVKTHISLTGIRTALNILEKEPKGYVILDPYGGIMNTIHSDYIAFPHRNGNLFAIQYLVAWFEEDNDKREAYVDWIRNFYDAMADYVSAGPRAAYINYMDFDLGVMEEELINPVGGVVEMARVWGEKYFLKNYDRLVRAKTRIDPNNVFSNQQGIPPVSYGRAKAK